jgi:hypothetical protein
MTPIWTAPRTWATGELVTAAQLNEQVRDNLERVATPNYGNGDYTSGANHTTTSATFGNVDAANITFNITSAGGMYWLGFSSQVFGSTGAVITYFDIAVDGTRIGDATIGLIRSTLGTGATTFTVIAPTVLTSGTRTITLQWRVSSGTGTLVSTNGVNWFYAGI